MLRLAGQQLVENTLHINLLIQNRNLKKALKRCARRILLVNCKKKLSILSQYLKFNPGGHYSLLGFLLCNDRRAGVSILKKLS